MTTKKQKHQAAVAKRDAFLAEEKARGLELQRLSKEVQDNRTNRSNNHNRPIGDIKIREELKVLEDVEVFW